MKNKYSKGPYWKFKDQLSKENKNVVFYHLLTIIEEEYQKLFDEVEHFVNRNLVKDELIESISYLFKLHDVDEMFKNDLLNAINQYFETYHNVKGNIIFYFNHQIYKMKIPHTANYCHMEDKFSTIKNRMFFRKIDVKYLHKILGRPLFQNFLKISNKNFIVFLVMDEVKSS